jgi:SAM-dependent methyltransferase
VEAFLEENADAIRGRVLEVGDASYTRRFGGSGVQRSDVLDVRPAAAAATLVGDLQDAPHIADETFDCVILTQTLQLIFNPASAVRTVHRILRPGGTLLLTAPGITSSGDPAWRETWYWSFTTLAVERLLKGEFSPERVEVRGHGNVLTSAAFLYGLATEELTRRELDVDDPDYATVVTARADKT